MSIKAQWHSLRSESAPEAPGVYELGDFNGTVLYTGSSANLKQSVVRQANGQEPCVKDRAVWFRYEQTSTFVTRLDELLAEYEDVHGALPPCNGEDSPA